MDNESLMEEPGNHTWPGQAMVGRSCHRQHGICSVRTEGVLSCPSTAFSKFEGFDLRRERWHKKLMYDQGPCWLHHLPWVKSPPRWWSPRFFYSSQCTPKAGTSCLNSLLPSMLLLPTHMFCICFFFILESPSHQELSKCHSFLKLQLRHYLLWEV